MLAHDDLIWNGDELFRRGSRKPLLRIVPDKTYPSMWRVILPSGELSGMLNKTRARDCARRASRERVAGPGARSARVERARRRRCSSFSKVSARIKCNACSYAPFYLLFII